MSKLQWMRIQRDFIGSLCFLVQGQGYQTYNDNVEPEQGYNQESLKDLALVVFQKRTTLLFFLMYVNCLP